MKEGDREAGEVEVEEEEQTTTGQDRGNEGRKTAKTGPGGPRREVAVVGDGGPCKAKGKGTEPQLGQPCLWGLPP